MTISGPNPHPVDVTATNLVINNPANNNLATPTSRLPDSSSINQQLTQSSEQAKQPSRLKQLASEAVDLFASIGKKFMGGTVGLLGFTLAIPLLCLTPISAGIGFVVDKLGLIEYEMTEESIRDHKGNILTTRMKRLEGQSSGAETGALITIGPALLLLNMAEKLIKG